MKSLKMLSGLMIMLLLCNFVFAATPIANYSFDVDASDATGNFNGTLEGDASIVNDATRCGVLYLKDDGYVTVPPEVTAEMESFSFSAWVNYNGSVEWAGLMGMGIDKANKTPYWDFHIQGGVDTKGTLSYYASEISVWPGDGTAQTVTGYTLPSAEWTHIAFTFEIYTGGTVYINGVAQAQEDWNSSNDHDVSPQLIQPEIVTIGNDAFNQGTLTDTYIDDFQFFKQALTADEVTAIYNNISDVETNAIAVKDFSLAQNYPNPFNPTTQVEFSISQRMQVNLEVYNAAGQLVETIVNETLSAGSHSYTFNAQNLPTGVYCYKLESGSDVQTRKMVLMK